ncbi:MAG: hypothetical protein ABIK09_17430 [Pseudomonadota bacterium]
MRWFLVILSGLSVACGPAHHRNGTSLPADEVAKETAVELFLVVDLDGVFYIQVDIPALAGLVDPKDDVTRVEMVYESEGWAFLGTLSAAAARRVHRALGPLGPLEVMDGGRPAEELFMGAPILVGRVVPHFGEIQEMEDNGIVIDDEDQGELRRKFLAGTMPVIMIPIQGDVYDVVTLWARTRSDQRPKVAVFEAGPAGPRDDEAAQVAATMPAWAGAIARVDLAYKDADLGDAPITDESLWSAAYLDEDDQPVGPTWIYFYQHYGEAACGQGPDEARLGSLWTPKGSLDKPLVLVADDSTIVVIEPFVVGDLDGDGAIEMIGATNELTREIQLLRIKDGSFETLKTAAPIYRDCPC